MIEWIKKYLHRRLDRKRQNVIRLRWQQAQLQKRLEQEKLQRDYVYGKVHNDI